MSNPLLAQQEALRMLVLNHEEAQPPAWLKPGSRPAIYQNAYAGRLMSALRDNHSVLHRALGDEGFDALALAYIEAHPSRRASIRWFGDELAAFMAERGDLVPHPALVDIARMDWALRTAFDAADAPALTLQDLTATPPEDWPALSFTLHPGTLLLALDWAIEPAWHVLQQHDPASGDEAPALPEPEARAHHLLVWRQGLETRWRSIEPTEAQMLQAVQRGEPFAGLCALLTEVLGDEAQATQQVVGLLGQWLNDGILRG